MPKIVSKMTPDQFKAGLRFLNMSYSGFSRLTGKTEQSAYAYASGRRPIPKLVSDLLNRLVAEGRVEPEFHRKRRTAEQMAEDKGHE